jgi:hypothetical protein
MVAVCKDRHAASRSTTAGIYSEWDVPGAGKGSIVFQKFPRLFIA